MKLTVIGLGKMGTEIVTNLLRAGHDVTVYDRIAEKTRTPGSRGARVALTPQEAVSMAEVVLTIVLDDAALEEVTFGPNGIIDALPEGAVHAGLSTISLELAKRMKKEHARRGREDVGAPMFGRPEAAREAKLVIVTGGAPSSISKLQPIFRAIGPLSFTAGAEPWHANLFKLCGNFMISSMLETFGEAQALIRKAGLEPNEFVQLMAEFWGSAVYRNYGTLIATGMYAPPGATLALGLKDNRLLLKWQVSSLFPFRSRALSVTRCWRPSRQEMRNSIGRVSRTQPSRMPVLRTNEYKGSCCLATEIS
jgi:3-hydroxyisobutyrate dehydrogenase-like beta-hydroxyacid dehydrogenase